MSENAIVLKDLSKRYSFTTPSVKARRKGLGDFWALKEVSLSVPKGEVLGIVGRNGAGKTTLLNIIAGTLSNTQGECYVDGKVLGLFNLGVGFQDELTGRENIFLNGSIIGATTEGLNNRLSAIIEFSELGDFIDMPLGAYSQGMRLRLGFSIIANLDFEIFVIDEILAVGDTLFQNKCFERLMDLKRKGKTLIITSQNMNLIERLCDRAIVLEHGGLVFSGDTLKAINQYHKLLNTSRFSVGPIPTTELVENTKKWTDDRSSWGERLGTKEVTITRVRLLNRFGFETTKIKTQRPLRIKVSFLVKNTIKTPHFGIAIFRDDGVYCYGPNTKFDGYKVNELKPGKGTFTLDYNKVLLAPGRYRISVAVWDKNETIAYDYHKGCYKLLITGNGKAKEGLLNMLVKSFQKTTDSIPNIDILGDRWEESFGDRDISLKSVRLLNGKGTEEKTFITNETLNLRVNFNNFKLSGRNYYLWSGIFRDDGIYCQGTVIPITNNRHFDIVFPNILLLPGGYRFSLGIWDKKEKRFLMCHHGIYKFNMVFNKQDHGTVYMPHRWRILHENEEVLSLS